MAGLLPDITCDDPDGPPRCNALFDLGEYLMLAGMEALEDFVVDESCGEPIRGYVSMGDPRLAVEDVACGALITPWLMDYGLTQSATSQMDRAAGRRTPVSFSGRWRVEFREACYPLDQGTTQPRPVPIDQLHEVHRHIYAHGTAVFHGVLSAYKAGTLYPDASSCPTLTFGRLTPVAPQGIVVGWHFDVVAEL